MVILLLVKDILNIAPSRVMTAQAVVYAIFNDLVIVVVKWTWFDSRYRNVVFATLILTVEMERD